MGDRLDDVARMMAAEETVPRRKAVRGFATLLGGGLFGVLAGRSPASAAPPVRCQPGTELCGDVCRDTSINPDHCGACGRTCPPGQMCRNGTCVSCICEAACPSGQTRCDGVCVDTETSSTNCGSCGNVCPSGQSCVNGVCQQCPSDMCNGNCVDLATDKNNCGTCGNVCPGDTSCIDGTCACPPGTAICGTQCATLGQACNTGLPGVCEAGTTQCVDGNVTCVPDTQPQPEICNGLDDDCDGQVDEGNPGGGQPCNTGLPDTCATGVTNCVNGQLVCTPPPGC